jgi:hypothetical protein
MCCSGMASSYEAESPPSGTLAAPTMLRSGTSGSGSHANLEVGQRLGNFLLSPPRPSARLRRSATQRRSFSQLSSATNRLEAVPVAQTTH